MQSSWLESGGTKEGPSSLQVDGLLEDFQRRQSIDFDEFVRVMELHGFVGHHGLLQGIFKNVQKDDGRDTLDPEEVMCVLYSTVLVKWGVR